jgi:hypothetical protein
MQKEQTDIVKWNFIKEGEGSRVKEKLYFDSHEVDWKYSDGMIFKRIIVFGNSGFAIDLNGEAAQFHFCPEGEDYKNPSTYDENSSRKYSMIMCSCFYYLYSLGKNISSELSFDINGIGYLCAFTNPRFASALERLFLKSNVPNIFKNVTEDTQNTSGMEICIDLFKFSNLDSADPLIVFIKKSFDDINGVEITRYIDSELIRK